MYSTFSPIVTEVKPLHSSNVLSSIEVTLLGIVTEFKALKP